MAFNGFLIDSDILWTEMKKEVDSWNHLFYSTGFYVKIEKGFPIFVRKTVKTNLLNKTLKNKWQKYGHPSLEFTYPLYKPTIWIDKIKDHRVGTALESTQNDNTQFESQLVELAVYPEGIQDISNINDSLLRGPSSNIYSMTFDDLQFYPEDETFTLSYFSTDTIKYLKNGRTFTQSDIDKKQYFIFSGSLINAGRGTTQEIEGEHFTLKIEAYSPLELVFHPPVLLTDSCISPSDLISSELLVYQFHQIEEMPTFVKSINGFKNRKADIIEKMRSEVMTSSPNNSIGVPCPPDWIPEHGL